MEAHGFRVWYDKGIQVGIEFNDRIAEKVKGCAALLSFNTDELFGSGFCMQELLYAANKDKKIVNICFPLSQDSPE